MGVSDARAGLAEGGGAETALCVAPAFALFNLQISRSGLRESSRVPACYGPLL